ncbi:hypothetical protein NC653_004570 [Populus alba x Populus x berolinensis]|uniref:Uncharacterized protein n=1 Tax=Populus alba x Populus x berolinensis TaxID=444605 RepID=A0AAD6RUJ4_9ROSI|nr:hypothetical protein NC653_004570 [Populus alba x Populus x berolinensis]
MATPLAFRSMRRGFASSALKWECGVSMLFFVLYKVLVFWFLAFAENGWCFFVEKDLEKNVWILWTNSSLESFKDAKHFHMSVFIAFSAVVKQLLEKNDKGHAQKFLSSVSPEEMCSNIMLVLSGKDEVVAIGVSLLPLLFLLGAHVASSDGWRRLERDVAWLPI